jgi:hypothetical protein
MHAEVTGPPESMKNGKTTRLGPPRGRDCAASRRSRPPPLSRYRRPRLRAPVNARSARRRPRPRRCASGWTGRAGPGGVATRMERQATCCTCRTWTRRPGGQPSIARRCSTDGFAPPATALAPPRRRLERQRVVTPPPRVAVRSHALGVARLRHCLGRTTRAARYATVRGGATTMAMRLGGGTCCSSRSSTGRSAGRTVDH